MRKKPRERQRIVADSIDELNEALAEHIANGWREIMRRSQVDGSIECHMERDRT